jgi:hypothetical protein
VLVCPLHLYTFRWTDGTSPGGAAPLRMYPVHEESGQLVVTVVRLSEAMSADAAPLADPGEATAEPASSGRTRTSL